MLTFCRKLLKDDRGVILVYLVAAIGAGAAAVAAGMAAKVVGSPKDVKDTKQTATNFRPIRDALRTYVVINDTVPCPADGRLGRADGNYGTAMGACAAKQDYHVVPWRTLGISERYSLDGWGRRIGYFIDPSSAAAGSITGEDEADTTNEASVDGTGTMIVLVSYGEDGAGSYGNDCLTGGNCQIQYAESATADQAENTDNDLTFTNPGYDGRQASYFDDLLYTISCTDVGGCSTDDTDEDDDFEAADASAFIMNHRISGSTDPITDWAQEIDDGDGAEHADGDDLDFITGELNPSGGALTDAEKLDPIGNTNGGGERYNICLWRTTPLDWTDGRLSTYLDLQMGIGETDITETQNTNDGYVFVFATGDIVAPSDSTAYCGNATGGGSMAIQDMGLEDAGSTNLDSFKFGLEFDNWDNGGNEPAHNHMALTRGNSPTHGAGSSTSSYYDSAPPCEADTGVSDAVNGAVDWGCSVRINETTMFESLLSDAAPQASDYSLSNPPPYITRVDLYRNCDQGCGSCENDDGVDHGNYMYIRAWAYCRNPSDGSDNRCTDMDNDYMTELDTVLEYDQSDFSNRTIVFVNQIIGTSTYIELAGAGDDFLDTELQVGDYVRVEGTVGLIADFEATIARITADRIYFAYNQVSGLPIGIGTAYTITRLVPTINACMLEPGANNTGTPDSTRFDSVYLGVAISNSGRQSIRISRWGSKSIPRE